MTRTRWVAVAVVLLLAANACGDDDTTADTADEPATTTELTPSGIADLHVGDTEAQAMASGLVGEFSPTCEVVGQGHTSARLVDPFEGFVIALGGVIERMVFESSNVATAPGGVRVGDDVDAAIAAFEAVDGWDADLDTTTEDVFGVWILRVTEGDTPRFEAVVDPVDRVLTSLGAPRVFICD